MTEQSIVKKGILGQTLKAKGPCADADQLRLRAEQRDDGRREGQAQGGDQDAVARRGQGAEADGTPHAVELSRAEVEAADRLKAVSEPNDDGRGEHGEAVDHGEGGDGRVPVGAGRMVQTGDADAGQPLTPQGGQAACDDLLVLAPRWSEVREPRGDAVAPGHHAKGCSSWEAGHHR